MKNLTQEQEERLQRYALLAKRIAERVQNEPTEIDQSDTDGVP